MSGSCTNRIEWNLQNAGPEMITFANRCSIYCIPADHPHQCSARTLARLARLSPTWPPQTVHALVIVRQPSLFLRFLLPLRLISPFVVEHSFQPSRTREEHRPIRHQSDACSLSHLNLPLYLLQAEPLERCYYSPWLQSNPSA